MKSIIKNTFLLITIYYTAISCGKPTPQILTPTSQETLDTILNQVLCGYSGYSYLSESKCNYEISPCSIDSYFYSPENQNHYFIIIRHERFVIGNGVLIGIMGSCKLKDNLKVSELRIYFDFYIESIKKPRSLFMKIVKGENIKKSDPKNQIKVWTETDSFNHYVIF